MTLPIQIQADNLEAIYKNRRRAHRKSSEVWVALRRKRLQALRIDVREAKRAKQLNLFR